MRFFIIILFLCVIRVNVVGQDTQYSQFYSNPIYLNPAFAGTASGGSRAVFVHRVLLPNLPRAFKSSTFSFDHDFATLNSGVGLLINNDSRGTATSNNITASLIYSYRADISNKLAIRAASKFGYGIRSFNAQSLLLGDQLDFGGNNSVSGDPIVNDIQSKNFFDVGAGLLAYTSKYWLGVNIDHLTTPNTSLTNNTSNLPMLLSVHIGGRFLLSRKGLYFKKSTTPTIAPSILYKRQGTFQQLDVGGAIHYKPIVFGLYYRGLPILKNEFAIVNQDAVIFLVGFEKGNFELGYSYDMNISELKGSVGGGAHEFSINYKFSFINDPSKTPSHMKRLECPAFYKKRR